MSYREIKGNLLDLFDKGEFEIIGHGANCQGIMEAGIALQIKERYPDAYYADRYCELGPTEKLGNYSCSDDETIFNFYTQYNLGNCAEYIWLKSALKKFAIDYYGNKLSIGLPQIGCGIGGLKWELVSTIIKKELKDFDVTVVIYDK